MKFRGQRHPTSFPVALTMAGIGRRCTVTSISSTGACVAGAGDLAVGAVVTVDYSVGRSRAIVKWTDRDKAGIAFEHGLAPESLNRIRYAVRGSSPQKSHRIAFTELR